MKTIVFITGYELKHSLKTRRSLLFGLIFFLFSFLIINIFAGAFDSIKVAIGGENNKLNSQFILSFLFAFLNMIGVILLAVLSGKIALKDIEYNALSLSYTLPVSKFDFLAGKFMAAFITGIFVFTCAVLGVLTGTVMPYLDPVQFGPATINNYLFPFITMIVPNVLFLSALFFMLGSVFRNYFVNWLAIILLYGIYYGSKQLGNDPDYSYLAGIIDPFGINAINNSEVGLSSEQLNSNVFDPNHVIMFNRFFWIFIGVLCLLITYIKFSFQYSIKKQKRTKGREADIQNNKVAIHHLLSKPVNTVFSTFSTFKQFLFLIKYEWQLLFKNFYFKTILFIGFILLIISSLAIGKIYDTNTYPVAYNVSEVFLGATRLFLFVVITIFSGEMIWRERSLNTHYVGDALPVNITVKYFSKIAALTLFVFVAHLFFIIFGLLIQYFKGYTNYELSVYKQLVLGIGFTSILFTIGLAFIVQALVSNRFVGYFIMLAYFFFKSFLADSVLEDKTFNFNSSPFIEYSDMNEFGYNVPVFILYKFYWLIFIVLLLVIANKFYPTGIDIGFKTRLQHLKKQLHVGPYKYGVIALSLVFILCGSFMYYNIHVKNIYESSYEEEQQMVSYEKNYSSYKNKPQPVTTNVVLSAELYPEKGSLNISGNYWLKNNSSMSISEIYVNPMETDSIWFSIPAVLKTSSKYFKIYRLNESLAVNDSLQLFFELENTPNGFSNNGVESIVSKNGTFFDSNILPAIGYNEGFELQTNSRRRKFGLAEKTIFAKPMNDPDGIATNMLGQKSLINLKITASTSSSQTILAPGELVRQWTYNGRNYFAYESKRPINNFYSVLSAEYALAKDVWKSDDSLNSKVNLAIYHHPTHTYNLNTMMNGMKEALSYYHKNYSSFQYNELSIVEFPRYNVFAQSFSGYIPFSEGIGFIADLKDVNIDSASVLNDDDVTIDYPFYVTAHEVAHQWWAHQVCAADVEGASLIIETLSQYSALMVIKQHYGEEKMRKFLNMEGFQYLSSRSGGVHKENPLLTVVGDETEVFYRKGSVIMYALQDYIGETTVNNVLRKFIDKYAFKNAPYPTSFELVNEFEKVTPDSLKYIINDWFKAITLYSNKLTKATYIKNEDLEYAVSFTVNVKKYSYDKNGRETEMAVNDYLPFAIYNSKGKQIYLEKIKVKQGINNITIKLGRKPETLILDPYNELLDKDWVMKKITIKNS